MSSFKANMRWEDALKSAEAIKAVIAPLCLRCEIAGSIRRKVPFVGDIELVSIPNPKHLFELRKIANSRWGEPQIGAFPSKYTRIRSNFNIDFFWTTRECWGVCFFVRTGSADFVRRGFSRWARVSKGGHSEDCRFHHKDLSTIETPEEADVFKALRAPYLEPEKRI